jgi:5-methylcytosine-specific restriction endonuclease McrA
MDDYYNELDNQTNISDITEKTVSSENSEEFRQKREEINKMLDNELNKLNRDEAKDKAKAYNIIISPKTKKQDINTIICSEFDKYWTIIMSKKIPELKNICKVNKIAGVTGLKKDGLCLLIMTYYAVNCILNPELEKLIVVEQKEIEKPKELEKPSVVENSLEELEKQKQEIERKMSEAIEKQKLAELEKQRLVEIEKQKQAELEKQRLVEIENQKQEEKAELKRKKQSIPKNVRIIVWNHYIGEDIIKHRCLCCKKVVISNTNFEVGHVLSEKNGGTHEINNLRPICFACNHSMGAENMIDFVVKYGLYIG